MSPIVHIFDPVLHHRTRGTYFRERGDDEGDNHDYKSEYLSLGMLHSMGTPTPVLPFPCYRVWFYIFREALKTTYPGGTSTFTTGVKESADGRERRCRNHPLVVPVNDIPH